MNLVRLRFAPSPTGFLHVGGVRTALFNFLYARSQKGKFLLRIEDTDRERSQPQFEREILDSLRWLGLVWDEEPVRQSERLSIYQSLAEGLLQKELAYEEKKEGRRAVRFRMPKREVRFTDGLRGEVSFETRVFDDTVLLKSDGYPTYHWACVVDDHEMGITHVLRGEDHLTNTPKQILLFEAMGWEPPAYVHVPLILGRDGTPLSKRHGDTSVTHYRKEGFLAEALANYLALLGWGPERNQEFFRLTELVEKFSLKRLTGSAARFDEEKLRWLNGEHLRALGEEEYLERIARHCLPRRQAGEEFPPRNVAGRDDEAYLPAGRAISGGEVASPAGGELAMTSEQFNRIALLFRKRIQTFKDLFGEAAYCFSEVETYDLEALDRALAAPGLKEKLLDLKEGLEALPSFEDVVKLEAFFRDSAKRHGVEAKVLIHPVRLALTGKGVSPGLFELMRVLGKETCLKRLGRLIERL